MANCVSSPFLSLHWAPPASFPVPRMLRRIASPRQADGRRRIANGTIALTTSNSASAGIYECKAKRRNGCCHRNTARSGTSKEPTRSFRGSETSNSPGSYSRIAWQHPPASIQDGGAGPPATLPWPDPPSPATPDNTAWPDPSSPTHASNVVWPDPPAPVPADEAKGLKAPMLNRNSGGDIGSVKQVGAEMAATSYSKISIGALLLCAIGLVIAGILVRRWVIITLGRRPRTGLAQRAPRRRHTGARRTGNVANDETRRALQKLLQVLERQAVRG